MKHEVRRPPACGRFVIHEHHAKRLHFDLRLEIGAVLKSWAVPKGPSLNPVEKRLAVAVEDHALDYIGFEGRIAEGRYGAGDVLIWDRGFYYSRQDPATALGSGRWRFLLRGRQLRGGFTLLSMRSATNHWLLIKRRDRFAKTDWKLRLRLAP